MSQEKGTKKRLHKEARFACLKMPMKILNAICGFGLTPLYLAVEKNQLKTAKLLLKNGANVNLISFVGNWHRVTSLQLAFQINNHEMINLLLKYEPEVGRLEALEVLKLPLQYVVKKDFRNIFKLMCKSGIPKKYFSKEDVFELFTLAKSTNG